MPEPSALATSGHSDEARFEASRRTLLVDGFMTNFIKIGGVLVIVAVLGIFVFILLQIVPLFQDAEVRELKSVQLPQRQIVAMGVDEWGEMPFVIGADGKMLFSDLAASGAMSEVDLVQVTGAAPAERPFSAVRFKPQKQELALGAPDGRVTLVNMNFSSELVGGERRVRHRIEAGEWLAAGKEGNPVVDLDVGDAGDTKLIAVIQQDGPQRPLHVLSLARKRSLLGGGKLAISGSHDLTAQLTGAPVEVHVNSAADSVVVLTAAGDVDFFVRNGSAFERRQSFKPFGDLADSRVASLDFLFGDVSLVATGATGANRIFSQFRAPGSEVRTFGKTKEFPQLPGGATFYASSVRNKAFVTGTGGLASLRHSTTETVRWEQTMPFAIERVAISGKYERLVFLDREAKLHVCELDDPHPETSWRGLFGKVWYEGYSEPSYEWQSTGGSDEFEPKLSLVPLIVGTLKGTLYAMLFAVPIALAAAVYASQFAHPRFRAVVKPAMEIMASLPSVVLGFLAALWLAPLIERRVPSILLIALGLPAVAFAAGWIWSGLPFRIRRLIKPGYEFIAFLPMVLAVTWLGWELGPAFERIAFSVIDPATGAKVADFRQWWPHATGADFQQRNSLVVGFVMGFAVIPILFTIAEDALSNVPMALRSASLALGATRWQTAMKIVLPTASAGIFSALMVGLGRAVGETMIVVMATGNTPIMELNLFSGMRTLSANIAVELPEAPVNGTLYRTLFLGAMLLFLATFVVNTAAELLRQRLREKYKTV